MTRREELMEQYEDALFALLMDDLAEAQGIEALKENERLKTDPEAAVPEETQRRCLQTINRYFARQTWRKTGRGFSVVFRGVAVAVLVAVLLFSTAFAAFPSFRTAALNFAMETFGDHTDFWMDTVETSVGRAQFEDYEIQVRWLPNGFSLLDSQKDGRGVWNCYGISNSDTKVEIQVFWKADMRVSVDTENAKITLLNINGYEAVLAEKSDTAQIVWTDRINGLLWLIYGTNLSTDDIVLIAENTSVI